MRRNTAMALAVALGFGLPAAASAQEQGAAVPEGQQLQLPAEQAPAAQEPIFAGEVVGRPVQTAGGLQIGQVVDALITDGGDAIESLIVETTGPDGAPKLVAVDYDRAEVLHEAQVVAVDMTAEELAGMDAFDYEPGMNALSQITREIETPPAEPAQQ